jgi:hypothetical protein
LGENVPFEEENTLSASFVNLSTFMGKANERREREALDNFTNNSLYNIMERKMTGGLTSRQDKENEDREIEVSFSSREKSTGCNTHVNPQYYESFGRVKGESSTRNNLHYEERKNTKEDIAAKLTQFDDYSSTLTYVHQYTPIRQR